MRPVSDIAKYITLVLCCVGIALTAVALFTGHWVEIEVDNVHGQFIRLHRGLLQWVCINQAALSGKNCIAKYPVFPGWLKSVFWFMVVSLALQVILLFSGIISLFLKSKKIYAACLCSFLALVNFILLSLAIGIFAAKSNNLYFETYVYKSYTVWCQLGWSYWIAILALAVSIVNTVLEGVQIFLVMKNIRISYPYPPEAMTTWKFTM